MKQSSQTLSLPMWCDKNKLIDLIKASVDIFAEMAERDGKGSDNEAVKDWKKVFKNRVVDTVTATFAQNIGVLAKYIRSDETGWINFEENEWPVLIPLFFNCEILPQIDDARKLEIKKQIELSRQKMIKMMSPKIPKPNDVMAVIVSDLIWEDRFDYYLKHFEKSETTRSNDTNERARKRNKTIKLLMDNLSQAVAIVCTPLDVLEGDVLHYKNEAGVLMTSAADLQIATIVTGFAQGSKTVAKTKKNDEHAQLLALAMDKAASQLSAEFKIKSLMADNIKLRQCINEKDTEIARLTSANQWPAITISKPLPPLPKPIQTLTLNSGSMVCHSLMNSPPMVKSLEASKQSDSETSKTNHQTILSSMTQGSGDVRIEQKINEVIRALIQHHEKLSSYRLCFFGWVLRFSGAHVAARKNFLEGLRLLLMDKTLTNDGKRAKFETQLEAYITYLKKGKSVRGLSNVESFFTGQMVTQRQLKILWSEGISELSRKITDKQRTLEQRVMLVKNG